MAEDARLRQAWEELPKTYHGRQVQNRHPDVRPEWIMRVIESPDSYEWMEYSTTPEEELRVWRVQVGWAPEIETWIKVVFEESETGVQFDTAYRLRDEQAEHQLRGRTRRSRR